MNFSKEQQKLCPQTRDDYKCSFQDTYSLPQSTADNSCNRKSLMGGSHNSPIKFKLFKELFPQSGSYVPYSLNHHCSSLLHAHHLMAVFFFFPGNAEEAQRTKYIWLLCLNPQQDIIMVATVPTRDKSEPELQNTYPVLKGIVW